MTAAADAERLERIYGRHPRPCPPSEQGLRAAQHWERRAAAGDSCGVVPPGVKPHNP